MQAQRGGTGWSFESDRRGSTESRGHGDPTLAMNSLERTMNSVTLYSNGTAVISREYEFKDREPLRIAIPVRKSDLDDVISSLSVFGNVTITAPPTYTPTNAQQTELTLNPKNVIKDLAMKLAGASVEIEAGSVCTGRLIGLHPHRREVEGTVVEQCGLVVLTEKGVRQFEVSAVTAIRFTDPLVQAEIDKALQASLGQIKPDSSLVELTVQPNEGATSAVVMYATPVAAWKIRYQLRLSSTETELEGQAVVDNDTDDDWTETLITTITGEPITFSTDLAEIRRPARSRVNVVSDRATGAVIAEPEIAMYDAIEELHAYSSAPGGRMAKRIMSAAAQPSTPPRERAVQAQAEVKESGDFSVFRSPNPVTIRAKKSAVIPLFRTALSEARAVLFYNEKDDPQRPFRAVRLKNEAAHSLGRGICEVVVDGDFQGKCVLETTKPGDDVLLIHAKETGVRVFKEPKRVESRLMAIKISEGTVYREDMKRQKTLYRIQNSHSAAFLMEIEHPRAWTGSTLAVSVSAGDFETVDIPSGQRIRSNLEAKGTLVVTVMEEQVEKQSFALRISWLQSNLIELKAPASNNKEIQKCLQLQKQVDALQADLKEKEDAAKTLEEEQTRLMKLIPNGHNEQANAWRTDLATAEKELRQLRRTAIPKLKHQVQEANKELQEALSGLQFSWS